MAWRTVLLLAAASLLVEAKICPLQRCSAHFFINVDESSQVLEQELYAVSTPGSPRHGHYFAPAGVQVLVSDLNMEHASVVRDWILSKGFTTPFMSSWSDLLISNASLVAWERVFPSMTCSKTGSSASCSNVVIPPELSAHVSHIMINPVAPFLQCDSPSALTRARDRRDINASTLISMACSASSTMSWDYYSLSYFPGPPAIFPRFENAMPGDTFSAHIYVLPQCYTGGASTQYMPLTTAYVANHSSLLNVSLDSICNRPNSALLNYHIEFTDIATGQVIQKMFDRATTCSTTTMAICVQDANMAYNVTDFTVATCEAHFDAPGLMDMHSYNMSVVLHLSDGSMLSNPVCVFNGQAACTPQIFIPSRTLNPSDVRPLYDITPVTTNPNISQGVMAWATVGDENYNLNDVTLFDSLSGIPSAASEIHYINRPYVDPSYMPSIQLLYDQIGSALGVSLGNVTIDTVTNNPLDPSAETSLDLQWITGMGEV